MRALLLLSMGMGCLPHTNPCDPAAEDYPQGCADTGPEDDAATPAAPAVTGPSLARSFPIDAVESAHGVVLMDASLWVADWEASVVMALSPDDGEATGDTLALGAINPIDLAFDGADMWVLSQGGKIHEYVDGTDDLVERAVSSSYRGIAFDGEYLAAASQTSMARIRDNGSTIYSTPIAGTGGPLGYMDGQFIQAIGEESGDITLKRFDATSLVNTSLIDEVTVDVQGSPTSPISGITVGTSHAYVLIGATASRDARVLVISLPSDWL